MEQASALKKNNTMNSKSFQWHRMDLLSSLEKNVITVQEYAASVKDLEKEERSLVVSVRCLMINIL